MWPFSPFAFFRCRHEGKKRKKELSRADVATRVRGSRRWWHYYSLRTRRESTSCSIFLAFGHDWEGIWRQDRLSEKKALKDWISLIFIDLSIFGARFFSVEYLSWMVVNSVYFNYRNPLSIVFIRESNLTFKLSLFFIKYHTGKNVPCPVSYEQAWKAQKPYFDEIQPYWKRHSRLKKIDAIEFPVSVRSDFGYIPSSFSLSFPAQTDWLPSSFVLSLFSFPVFAGMHGWLHIPRSIEQPARFYPG